MPFDPSLPSSNELVSSAELRSQFIALNDDIAQRALQIDVEDLVYSQSAGVPSTVAPLTLPISNPPTQAEVQALVAKINELLAALNRT